MYHQFDKRSLYLRTALYNEYNHKCIYCGNLILQPRYMHVDHILPTNRPTVIDADYSEYLTELENGGFIQDSIENYLPACSACNREKSNRIFKTNNIRYYHEIAYKHTANILKLIDSYKTQQKECYYEPVDDSLWLELDYSYQRDLSYAVMGYRLTQADVVSCPRFPQVDRVIKQLSIVDYAMLLGETGCGKSISLFQVGYSLYNKGWHIYLLRDYKENNTIVLPDNTENNLYLVDDAQLYPESVISSLVEQSRPYRKVLLSKTISGPISSESIILTNKEAVDILYYDFLNRKTELLPIVNKCDKSIGVNMYDVPIEHRLENARKAGTPWQFSYTLRGGWNTIKDLYMSICKHKDCDLLVATIAAFQILGLDNAVDLKYINMLYDSDNHHFSWEEDDIKYLVEKHIVLSEDEIRIVHLESANIIVALFFDCIKTEKQSLLIEAIESQFIDRRISPLGIVWLCNGCRHIYKYYYSVEEIFLTPRIKKHVNTLLETVETSEDVRDIMLFLEKMIMSSRTPEEDIQFVIQNERLIIDMINRANSISALGIERFLNTLYNHNRKLYNAFSRIIDWNSLMIRMQAEEAPNYYAWAGLFNRGLLLVKKKRYLNHSNNMFDLMKWVIERTTVKNIHGVTYFLRSVSFMNTDRIHELMPELSGVYKEYFDMNMEEAIHIFGYDYLGCICGISIFDESTPTIDQSRTGNMIVDAIPVDKFAVIIARSSMQEWQSIREVFRFIITFNKSKFKEVIHNVNLEQLSVMASNSWGKPYEICLILSYLMYADKSMAKKFLAMNSQRIRCYYSVLITIDAKLAVESNLNNNIPLDLLTDHWWDESLAALKALKRTDVKFAAKYIDSNRKIISERFSDVTALDFTEKHSLEFLKLVKEINPSAYEEIIMTIDKKRVLQKWDKCGGITPRKKKWVEKRKVEYLGMLTPQ